MATKRKSIRPSAARVESISLDARALVTVGPEHEVWNVVRIESAGWKAGWLGASWTGAIVRVRPPATATNEDVASLKAWLVGAGAAAVRVEAKAQADVPAPTSEEPRPHASQREVVMRRAESSERRGDLVALLDFELAKVSL